MSTIEAGNGWRYTLTGADVLALAKAAQFEGGDDPSDVLWTYAQRAALYRVPSVAALVEAHSQPLNPKWRRDGVCCAPAGSHPGERCRASRETYHGDARYCSEAALSRRDMVAGITSLSQLRPAIVSVVERFIRGEVANRVPKAVDFADAAVSTNFLESNPGSVLVRRAGNWFIATATSKNWPANYVTIAGSTGGGAAVGAGSFLVLLGLGAAAAWAISRSRKKTSGGLKGAPPGLVFGPHTVWENEAELKKCRRGGLRGADDIEVKLKPKHLQFYGSDASWFAELGVTMTRNGVRGSREALEQLAKFYADDGDPHVGKDAASRRAARDAAAYIRKQLGGGLKGLGKLAPEAVVREYETEPRQTSRTRSHLPRHGRFKVRLTKDCDVDAWDYCQVTAEARDGYDRRLGFIEAMADGSTLDVNSAFTSADRGGAGHGRGVGTRLYEALAQYACDEGLRLRSDLSLSDYSESFWQKQVQKGRAEWDNAEKRYVLTASCWNAVDLGRVRR